jgi:hypothetical protein
VVDSWQIFGGPIRVAKLDSGVVYGTSRGRINSLLFEWAVKNPLIKILFNHKLVDMDFDRFICFPGTKVLALLVYKYKYNISILFNHKLVDIQCDRYSLYLRYWYKSANTDVVSAGDLNKDSVFLLY